MADTCSLCARDTVRLLLDLGEHPIGHQLLDAPREVYVHAVRLGLCDSCGFLQLIDPIPPERLYTRYNWLSEWKWNPHVPELLELVDGLPGVGDDSFILEIGSNDGSFLAGLRDRGYANVLGVEPAQDAVARAEEREIETLATYFTPQLARELRDGRGPCDLLVAREVLEHVADLAGVAEAAAAVLRPGGHVVVEVPDFGAMLRWPDYSVLWEEHANFFTRDTLARYLGSIGVEVTSMETVTFSGATLVAAGRATGAPKEPEAAAVETARADAERYAATWPRFRDALAGYLEGRRRSGRRIALYGAGVRASCLVNYAGLAPFIDFAVDDEPAKQGKFLPGSGLPIEASDALARADVDLCLLAVNAENEERVIARHSAFAARGGEFVSLHPPSPRLPAFWLDYASGAAAAR